MLLDPNQPLFLKWTYLPKLAPWLIKYLGHANADAVRRRADALAPIIGDSLADHQAMAAGTGAEKWIVPSDYLFLYNDRAHYESDAFGWSIRKQHGFEWDILEGADFRYYDPAYGDELGFAARCKDHGRISDPGRYVKDLAAHVMANGGRFVQANVRRHRAGKRRGDGRARRAAKPLPVTRRLSQPGSGRNLWRRSSASTCRLKANGAIISNFGSRTSCRDRQSWWRPENSSPPRWMVACVLLALLNLAALMRLPPEHHSHCWKRTSARRSPALRGKRK